MRVLMANAGVEIVMEGVALLIHVVMVVVKIKVSLAVGKITFSVSNSCRYIMDGLV